MSKRIDLIASLTKNYHTICDVGCDHGLTIIKAIKDYNVSYAYAIDINEEPLERAKLNVCKNSLSAKVSFLLSDGFNNVDFSFDVAILSGMGGILITDILTKGLTKLNKCDLILSPQGDSYLVRKFLANNSYQIIEEYSLIENKKYYEIIKARYNKTNYTYFDLYFGPSLLRKKEDAFIRHYQKLKVIKQEAYTHKKDLSLLNDIYLYDYMLEDKMEKVNYYKTNYYNKLFIDDIKRDLIIIFPGGGYNHTSNREAENVAIKYNTIGYNAVVFHYRETLDDYKTLYPSIVKAILDLAKLRNVNNIYLNGFSAGGHLALHLANKIKEYNLEKIIGLILCYPVVSTKKECIHQGSFKYLLGDESDKLNLFSEELNVNINTPKLFIWHTVTDESVPVLNTIYLLEAYNKLNLNFEAHIYPTGNHGLSLATKDSVIKDSDANSHIASWFNLLAEWLEQ